MITDEVYIGGATELDRVDPHKIGAILNVAQDLRCMPVHGWPYFEYMQIGLVDGPGNQVCTYISAVLALRTLTSRNKTLVCCHEGGRSLAVSIMYMELSFKKGWNAWVEVFEEHAGINLPIPNEIHRKAFDKIDWEALRSIIGAKL